MRKRSLYLILLLCLEMVAGAKERVYSADIVVYGNSSSAVVAAVQVARMGKKALLVASDACLGGLTASGLGATDINEYRAVGGISREFYRRVYQYYQNPGVWTVMGRETYFDAIRKRVFTGRNTDAQMQWVFEPHVAQSVFREMLLEAGVQVIYGKLDRAKGVIKKGGRIGTIVLTDGTRCNGGMFIDASYEGDLMAGAGVSYIVGREANTVYGESVNGILPNDHVKKSRVKIDPYRIEGDTSSGVLPYVEVGQPGKAGEGDKRLQAYCFRFTLTDVAANRKEIIRPEDYRPEWYEYIIRLLQGNPDWTLKNILTITPMPNGKSDVNHADFVGANYGWPEGSYEEREEMKALHRSFTLGLIWCLSHDERVPVNIRKEMSRWGLAKDEYRDNGNFPYQVYVREARRMIGEYVMTEHEVTGVREAPEAVGLATYWFDSHIVSRFVDEKGALRDEGGFWKKQTVYPVAYGSIIPRRKECENLLVPVCLSASHAAYGSIRMEPVYMVLGQSAAIAGVLALERKEAVQELPYALLADSLKQQGQILKWETK
ncbi:FAD-dependent oxidoreductase [Culturomica sp.]|uniref:FAD-dependent oxidoreductase n=1 Tax=Culturomica sp. TaxID=1926652 RepID=UPI00257F5281|nr:FAD-dependent oxidoreductase [Culturomica sp.]